MFLDIIAEQLSYVTVRIIVPIIDISYSSTPYCTYEESSDECHSVTRTVQDIIGTCTTGACCLIYCTYRVTMTRRVIFDPQNTLVVPWFRPSSSPPHLPTKEASYSVRYDNKFTWYCFPHSFMSFLVQDSSIQKSRRRFIANHDDVNESVQKCLSTFDERIAHVTNATCEATKILNFGTPVGSTY